MGGSTKPARGMRDFLPGDVRRRRFVIGVVADVFESYGFEPIETPAVENIETLTGKYGEEGDRLIFKILKRGEGAATGEADLALRYDLTVPMSRVVAEYRGSLPKYFKRFQIQPVWRADRPQKGRFREFYQCDVDATGSTSMTVEAELLAAAADVLTRLGFGDFAIRLNHRQLLSALLDTAGVPAALHGTALVALDKGDKVGPDGVVAEMAGRGVPADSARTLVDLLFGVADRGRDDVLATLATFIGGHEAGQAALADVREILRLSDGLSAGQHIRIDPSLARGLGYYTGAIFEIAVADLAGSLGGGGRYDDLVGMFLGQRVPACGISLGLERILVVMGERGMFPPDVDRPPASVLVANFDAGAIGDTLALAALLRRGVDGRALAVEVYPDADKLGKQFKYASERGIPFVVVVGDQERQAGQVTVKTLASGTQAAVPRGDAARYIANQMGNSRG
ncbi:MAG: histidine--tRNA ligase [Vicinamibacterales bacterium]